MPDAKQAATIMLLALAAVAIAYRVPAVGGAVFGRS
jgi:hypothetical protein